LIVPRLSNVALIEVSSQLAEVLFPFPAFIVACAELNQMRDNMALPILKSL
jgi:hypothetical protein